MKSKQRLQLLISPTEIAEFTGMSLSTVSGWRSRYRDFPAPVVPGRAVRYDLEEIMGWVASPTSTRNVSWPDDAPGPLWLWSAAAEAFRVESLFPSPGDLDSGVNPAASAIASLVTIAATLRRFGKSLSDTFDAADDSFSELLAVAAHLEEDDRFSDLFVKPLSSVQCDPHLLTDLVGYLEAALTAEGALAVLSVVVDDPALVHHRFRSTATNEELVSAVELMAELKPNQILHDPCCGEGGLVARLAADRADTVSVVVSDSDNGALRIARCRLLLIGVNNVQAHHGDSLKPVDELSTIHADLVILDPPLADRKDSSLPWLNMACNRVADGGSAIVVLPAYAIVDLGGVMRRHPQKALQTAFYERVAIGEVADIAVTPFGPVGPVLILHLKPGQTSSRVKLWTYDGNRLKYSQSEMQHADASSVIPIVEKMVRDADHRKPPPAPSRDELLNVLIFQVNQLLDELPDGTVDPQRERQLRKRLRQLETQRPKRLQQLEAQRRKAPKSSR